MATENPPFADDVRIKTSNLYGISQLAMFDCQRVGIRGSLITIVFQAKATLVGTSSPSTLPQPTLLKLCTGWIWDLGSWKHQHQFWWRSKSSPKRTPIFGKNWTSLIFLIIIPTSIPIRSPCFPANKSHVFICFLRPQFSTSPTARPAGVQPRLDVQQGIPMGVWQYHVISKASNCAVVYYGNMIPMYYGIYYEILQLLFFKTNYKTFLIINQ